ncbi:hypothetical protein BaRGS_00010498 [Batillaria attramentaria]|uniref:Uncharacterized protein n=1 Tax=Batillaria attramentaria TaxID=370345 RepID=A0ABD0LG71_9CAEN
MDCTFVCRRVNISKQGSPGRESFFVSEPRESRFVRRECLPVVKRPRTLLSRAGASGFTRGRDHAASMQSSLTCTSFQHNLCGGEAKGSTIHAGR